LPAWWGPARHGRRGGRTTISASLTGSGVTRTATATVVVFGPLAGPLVGQWTGTVDGTPGTAGLTMQLNNDFTITAVGDAGLYTCQVAGEWAIAGSTVTAETQEVACTRTFITYTGSITGSQIAGTWTASSGANGTFTVNKP
jgi:hypothetical protein